MTECPRRGFVLLLSPDGREKLCVKTTCKTWGCHVCRKKVRQLVAMKIMYGVSSVEGPSQFITVTYRYQGPADLVNASTSAKHWAKLWRILKALPRWQNAAWFKVPELTQQGQVHFHALVTGVSGIDTCRTEPDEKARMSWLQRPCIKHCLEHDLVRAWYTVTGAFIGDCSTVRSSERVAHYVQKYMSKAFDEFEGYMHYLGYRRRYSASRNWSRFKPIRLAGTELGWQSVRVFQESKLELNPESEGSLVYTLRTLARNSEGHPLLERVGEPGALALFPDLKLEALRGAFARIGLPS